MLAYKIEYSNDRQQVCLIPCPSITTDDFLRIIDELGKEGYKYWLPTDHRRGFIFSKDKDD